MNTSKGVEALIEKYSPLERPRAFKSDLWRSESSGVQPCPNRSRRSSWRFWVTVCLLSVLLVVLRIASPAWSIVLSINQFNPVIERLGHKAVVSDVRISEADVQAGKYFPTFGRTENSVQFDNYSLILNGHRVFLHSGEFHTFRLPVPSLWPDILDKAKAAGLNAISVYTHMGLINPSREVVDFDGFRALQPLYDAAKEAGLWIVLRPGPYINAETSAGGIAHWATAEVAGHLRTNDSDWKAAWQNYIQAIIEVTVPNQVTAGGPVIAIQIDNEYNQQDKAYAEYFVELEDAYRNSGIVVPLTYNDPGPRRNFINGTGAVDLYGMDSYPQGFDCSNPTVWKPVPTDYRSYHAAVNPSQPWYIPEFQSGSYDAWGPTAPGYKLCRVLTGSDFQSVFNLQLWASNAKLINYYMFYGGTSWGAIPFPGVYTSYDYGAAITESRELTSKYDELKRQGMFLRSSPEFYKTNWIGNSSTGVVGTTSSAAFVTLLQNPDTQASFYIVRQTNSSSTAITNFKLNVTTPSEDQLQLPLVVPSITLSGRQSKLIVSNYAFGSSSTLRYSTAQIFFAGTIDGRDVLFLYGDSSQAHEAALVLSGTPNPFVLSTIITFITSTKLGDHTTIISVLPGTKGLVTIWDSDTQLVLFGDTLTAGTFWSPVISRCTEGDKKAEDPFQHYWGIGTNNSILVGGPYLVRGASISDSGSGLQLALRGDLKTDARLVVIGPRGIRSVTWNGEWVDGDVTAAGCLTAFGAFVGEVRVRAFGGKGGKNEVQGGIEIPKLTGWRYRDSLPEILDGFDDAGWVVANKTKTNSPFGMYYGDGRVLYGCDYGFCENVVLWHGYFNATGEEKSVNLSINGGEGFAASVWLNGIFLNTSFGNSTNNRNVIEETDETFVFPPGAVRKGGDNVLTIVQDNMGMNETDEYADSSKSPRGIRGFQLDVGNFTQWKVQGKIGGYTNYPDKVRGIFNEGGLFGERQGWHLPGYPINTTSWSLRDLALGLPDSRNGGVGVGFFVTTFELGISEGLDVMLSFTFVEGLGQGYRAVVFVNGWMMGKRVGNLGPQDKFPVHEGILEYNGLNTVAVALWVMEPNAVISPKLELTLDGVYDGGVGRVTTNNPGWSPVGGIGG